MRTFVIVMVLAFITILMLKFYEPAPEVTEPEAIGQIDGAVESVTQEQVSVEQDELIIEALEVLTPAIVEPEEELSQALTLTVRADEIAALYRNASWVHRGLNGPVLYVITFRTCPACLAFKEAELAGLEAAGVDVRWIVYARRDREDRVRSSTEERAVQAEIWLNRNWHLFEEWYGVDPDTFYVTSQLPPVADSNRARAAAVEEARALVDTLGELYAENEIELFIPALLWQENGEWKTYVGYDEPSFAPIRAVLTASQ